MSTAKKSFIKLETLKNIEKTVQAEWESKKIFEMDYDPLWKNSSKFLGTFPYPYMNGRLHVGHAFCISKCEFAVGFERLLGKKCLFPFGFHGTGMPIKACADKLRNEIETYGFPPKFPENQILADKPKAKSKVAAKTGKLSYQWNIMKSFGIQDDEIKKFVDPSYWLEYFPKNAINDLKSFGIKVDWRRSFLTTDINPFYDSFIKWQFWKLKEANCIKFGKRYTIFSPKDKQPCMDHDRTSGEGLGSIGYTVIKLKLTESPNPEIKLLLSEYKNIFLLAATLRPETVYGQTNCWIHPTIKYILFKSNNDDIFISTSRAARNMSFQGFTTTDGNVHIIKEIEGTDLLGSKIYFPKHHFENIYVLPMLSIKEDKGTGLVMSVPSDSPDDYAALSDLIKKQPLREKYGITSDMINEPIPIISVPNYGDICAKMICEQLHISSQNETDKLQKAKETIYKAAFYEGTIIYDCEYKGVKVSLAKKQIEDELVNNQHAFMYHEPEGKIVSRSGDECVVALCDQWYLNYGEENWKRTTLQCLNQLEVFSEEVKNNYLSTLDWLHEHACARSFGLGTKLPWEPIYLIESLSDSTIYMAYYTIAHFLQGNSLKGPSKTETNMLNIKPEQMTNEVWDYVFLKDSTLPKSSNIDISALNKLKQEFNYWYPVDLRVSGKDLISNHLTYYMYNHVAIWPNEPEKWPKAIRANGHLLLNSEKMSKSTGNFLTLYDGIEKYGADAFRIALADSGDTVEDANFVEKIADSSVLRLYNFIEWNKNILNTDLQSNHEEPCLFDNFFNNEIDFAIIKTKENYTKTNYREALKTGFYQLSNFKDQYIEYMKNTNNVECNHSLLIKYVYVQLLLLSPIAPHTTFYLYDMWASKLKQLKIKNVEYFTYDNIFECMWPNVDQYDSYLLKQSQYVGFIIHNSRVRAKGRKNIKKVSFYYTREYIPWQEVIINFVNSFCNEHKCFFPNTNDFTDLIKSNSVLNQMDGKMKTKIMAFTQFVKERKTQEDLEIVSLELSFDEKEVLLQLTDFLKKILNMEELEILEKKDAPANLEEQIKPGFPLILFS